MWIFLNDSFISVVEDPTNPFYLVVRARRDGDLEAIFGDRIEIDSQSGTDYMYRVRVPRKQLVGEIATRIYGIDYTNFKDSVEDEDRKLTYMRVWTEMAIWQDLLHDMGKWLQFKWEKMKARTT